MTTDNDEFTLTAAVTTDVPVFTDDTQPIEAASETTTDDSIILPDAPFDAIDVLAADAPVDVMPDPEPPQVTEESDILSTGWMIAGGADPDSIAQFQDYLNNFYPNGHFDAHTGFAFHGH